MTAGNAALERRLSRTAESGSGLPARLDARLRETGLLPRGAALTVALSGGLDSVVLLDLLRLLQRRWGWSISAAHFDHRMRPGSAADAAWVARLCERLAVPLRLDAAGEPPPGSEAEARVRRYAFLELARAELGADRLVTAHQADDQAETVAFRLLRGTGLAGVAGIPARRSRIVRPLLPFWRRELNAHARARGLAHREDPTNRELDYARNRIRHVVLPAIEAADAPDFRRQLVRLARLARRARRALEPKLEKAVATLILGSSDGRVLVARSHFLAYDSQARAHLLRALVARVGPRPGRAGTRAALEFIRKGSSGRWIRLAGGVVIGREFDRIVIARAGQLGSDARREGKGAGSDDEVGAERTLELRGPPAPGAAYERAVTIGAQRWRVRVTRGGEAEPGRSSARFHGPDLDWPLAIRSRRPGDRIRLARGTRKLKKEFIDRKVGRWDRDAYPVVADSAGVLWVVGLVRGARAAARDPAEVVTVTVRAGA